MVYQLRVEAVKMYFHKKNEDCDDTRARTIELSEDQYLTCKLDWCNKTAWAWFSKYWTTDEYKTKRLRAQESCMSSEDNCQNRGSRNFSETQQFLEHKFGPDKSSTINTYAVMKSGIKIVDSTGRPGPIPSQKAQRRLDEYKELVSDENAQELDGKALYTMGNGMKHGRALIGDGAVDKANVLIHGKSVPFKPINPDDYERVLKENDQLKRDNELNAEENSVNRELVMSMYADVGIKPPAALLRRLESIDARRQQANGSPHRDYSQSVDDRHISDSTDAEGDDDEGDDDDDVVHEHFAAFLSNTYGPGGNAVEEEDLVDEEDVEGNLDW